MANAKRTTAPVNNVAEVESLFCYLRVSTQGQVDEGHSIENQRHLGQKVADKLGLKYVEMNEGGLSSVSSVRPVYEELKEGIRIGRIKNMWYLVPKWERSLTKLVPSSTKCVRSLVRNLEAKQRTRSP